MENFVKKSSHGEDNDNDEQTGTPQLFNKAAAATAADNATALDESNIVSLLATTCHRIDRGQGDTTATHDAVTQDNYNLNCCI